MLSPMPSHSSLTSAVTHYRELILDEAEALCRSTPAASAQLPEVLRVRGMIAARRGQRDAGIACIQRATALCPRRADIWADLGGLLSEQGRYSEALGAILRAVQLAPDTAPIYALLGRTLFRLKLLTEATFAFTIAAHFDGLASSIRKELGDVLLAAGRPGEAIEQHEFALRLNGRDVNAHCGLGRARLALRDWEGARQAFSRALHFDQERADAYAGFGHALLGLERLEEAVVAFRRGVRLSPEAPELLRPLAHALDLLGRNVEAVGVLVALGEALRAHNAFAESVAVYRLALKAQPDCLRALTGIGRATLGLGQPEQTMRYLPNAIRLDPHNAAAHIDLGRAFHLTRSFELGWKEYRWCYFSRKTKDRIFEQPLWDGLPLTGRTILLWADQGLGDAIQFLRYVPRLRRDGARVVVACSHRLLSLVRMMPDVAEAVSLGSPLPSFDVYAPLFAITSLFRDDRRIPELVPYLHIEKELIMKWRRRLSPSRERTIGISWGGNAHHRTASVRFVPLSAFDALADIKNVRFVSLQLGPQSAELLRPTSKFRVEILQDESCSLIDTAALVMNLDLVITVDTMTAHLAGALGRPVWTLLSHAPAWMWCIDGETTPWYPTMRLFRQGPGSGWNDVFDRLRIALTEDEVHNAISLQDEIPKTASSTSCSS